MRRLLLICCLFLAASAHAQIDTSPEVKAGSKARTPIAYRDLDDHRVGGLHFEHLHDKPLGNPEIRAAILTRAGTRFRRRYFRSDLTTIVNLYRAAGYMDAQIVSRRFALDNSGHVHIYLRIASGQRWHVSNVEIVRLDSVPIDEGGMHRRLTIAPEGVFRYGLVLEDERKLLTSLNQSGHPQATVQNRVAFDRSRRTATVTFAVKAGPRMVFGSLLVEPDTLKTRSSFIEGQLSFAEGDLYDPEHLRRSRSNLARTGLFRSVIFATPSQPEADSVQSVILRLEERPYLHVESRAYISTEDLGLTGNAEHRNFLGRGNRIGVDASLGRPLQGGTLYLTERNLLDSPADLTLSAGMTDEFGRTQVFADATDPRQFELLTTLHEPAAERQRTLGDSAAAAYIVGATYDYPSVERLWQLDATLGRSWQSSVGSARYLTQASLNWTQSRRRPLADSRILFKSGAKKLPKEGFGATGEDRFTVDDLWMAVLTNRARALNFKLDMQRDTRDHPIMSRRGALLHAEGLFAVEFGGATTRILDGALEARHYQPVGSRFVWAQAVRWVMTGSIRRDRQLPQAYWKSFGGDGSVRGVGRDAIRVVGGGRAGINIRNELRLDVGMVGLVGFWDRAGVWNKAKNASWQDMKDGYGLGLRYDVGLPVRFDIGWSEKFQERALYLSIGQAF